MGHVVKPPAILAEVRSSDLAFIGFSLGGLKLVKSSCWTPPKGPDQYHQIPSKTILTRCFGVFRAMGRMNKWKKAERGKSKRCLANQRKSRHNPKQLPTQTNLQR